ncbi:MAG TPA: PAS domain S-box protein [Polyangia bacterium]|nr:PAS domain S-box protein [Polyangia bacterium]
MHQLELERQNEELRRMQLELERSRDRYRALYDGAPFGYLTLARDGRIVEANPTAARQLGMSRAELVGRALPAFVDTADADRFSLCLRAVLARQPTEPCDLRLHRPAGTSLQVRVEMVLDADAGEPRLNTVIVDLSDLRQAQDELRDSEARFRELAGHVEDCFYVRELDGRISYVSPAFERIWGRPPAWVLGRESAWLDTVDADDRERVAAAWDRLGRGAPHSEVYRIHRPDGGVRWVHGHGFAVRGDDGRPLRNVGVVRDVTTERALEDQLRQAEKMEAVGTLAGGVAHNLRNVLQAVLASIGLAQMKGPEGPGREQALQRAVGAVQKGVALIDHLVAFSRPESAEVRLRALRLDDELASSASMIKVLLGERIRLELLTGAPGRVVLGDPVQLEQIVLNLVSNARDAMPDGGALAIRTSEEILDEPGARARGVLPGAYVVLAVQDTGTGMDAATRARVFEPFFTTKEPGRGTGLGLSMVFALIRQLGGAIEVDSAPGAGTTFSVYLPRLDAPIARAQGPRAPASSS